MPKATLEFDLSPGSNYEMRDLDCAVHAIELFSAVKAFTEELRRLAKCDETKTISKVELQDMLHEHFEHLEWLIHE